MDRRRLLKAMVCGAALTALTPGFPLAQPAPVIPPLTPPEATLGNAIGRWTGRVENLGQPANDNEVRRAIAQQITRSSGARGALPALSRAAPFLSKFGRVLGPVGLALSLVVAAQNIVVSSDGDYTNVQGWSTGPTDPRKYATTGPFNPATVDILAQLGENGARLYADTNRLYRSEWSTAQTLTGTGKEKYGPNWVHRYSKIDFVVKTQGVDQNGDPIKYFGHIFEYIGAKPSRPYQVPYAANQTEAGQAELAKIPAAGQVSPESLSDLLAELARQARAYAAANGLPQVVPDPAAYPPAPADFADPMTGADLLTPGATDRDVNLGTPEVPETNPNPDPGTGTPGTVAVSNWGEFSDPGFQLPPLEVPSIPTVPELIDQLANPLQAIIPTPPAGGVACPAMPWFMGQEVTQHCGALAQMQPWLGNLSRLFGNVAAFFIVIRD